VKTSKAFCGLPRRPTSLSFFCHLGAFRCGTGIFRCLSWAQWVRGVTMIERLGCQSHYPANPKGETGWADNLYVLGYSLFRKLQVATFATRWQFSFFEPIYREKPKGTEAVQGASFGTLGIRLVRDFIGMSLQNSAVSAPDMKSRVPILLSLRMLLKSQDEPFHPSWRAKGVITAHLISLSAGYKLASWGCRKISPY
jgi:hypothetical protein